MLIGGTYDWNGRGINDIEPSPTVTSLSPHYDSIDLRDYMYYRTRWGLSGSADYRVNNGSSLAVRGLYSTFRNWGQKWVYTLNDGDVPGRASTGAGPTTRWATSSASGRHTIGHELAEWDASGARSRMLQSGGNGGAKFKWNGADHELRRTTRPRRPTPTVPMFSASCFTPGPTNTEDIANYRLSELESGVGRRVGAAEPAGLGARTGTSTTSGDQFGTLEFGGKIRNAHKYNDSYTTTYTVAKGVTIPVAPFAGSFTDPNYYDKALSVAVAERRLHPGAELRARRIRSSSRRPAARARTSRSSI